MEPVAGIADAFYTAYSDAKRLVRLAESGKISINAMVGMYYAVSGIVTVVRMHKDGAVPVDAHNANAIGHILPDDVVSEAEDFVRDTFDSCIHPKTMKMISDMITDVTSELRRGGGAAGDDNDDCTRHESGAGPDLKQAARYDELRRLMSIREFAMQYDRMIGAGTGSSK